MAFTRVVGAGIHTAANINSHNIKSTGIVTATQFDGPFVNLNVTGVTTFAGDVSIGGTLTYEDVTNIDSVGLITARDGISVPDAKSIFLGNSNDLSLKHDGTNSTIDNNTGDLNIQGDVIRLKKSDGGKTMAAFHQGGSQDFYYDTTRRLYTTTTGAQVVGTLAGASEVGIQSAGTQIGAGITQLNFVGAGNTFKVDGTTVDISISGNTGAGGTWSSYTAGIATTKSVGINTNNFDDPDVVGAGNSFQGLYISNGMIIHDNTLNGNHYIGTAMNGLMAGPVTINGVLTVEGNYVVV